jgi:arylamine N-acetyltransferase
MASSGSQTRNTLVIPCQSSAGEISENHPESFFLNHLLSAMTIPLQALSLNMPHKLKLTADSYLAHKKARNPHYGH